MSTYIYMLLEIIRRSKPTLPEDIAPLLALNPVHYFPMTHNVINGEQVLFQDLFGTVPVTEVGQPIGYVKNLGSSAMKALSSGTQRPLWMGELGAQFDGVDDYLQCSDAVNLQNVPAPYTTVTSATYTSTDNSGRLIGLRTASGSWIRYTTGDYRGRTTDVGTPNPAMDVIVPSPEQLRPTTHILSGLPTASRFQVLRGDGSSLGEDDVSGITSEDIQFIIAIGDRLLKNRAMKGFIRYAAVFDYELSQTQIDTLPKVTE